MSIELEKAVVLHELELKLQGPIMRGVLAAGRGVDTAWKKLSPGSYHKLFEPEGPAKPFEPHYKSDDKPKAEVSVAPPKPPKEPESDTEVADTEVAGGLKNLGYSEAEAKSGASGLKGKTTEERMAEAVKRMPQRTTTHTMG